VAAKSYIILLVYYQLTKSLTQQIHPAPSLCGCASSEHQERATYPTPNVLPVLSATRNPHRRYPPTPVTVRSDTYAGQKMLTRKTEQKKSRTALKKKRNEIVNKQRHLSLCWRGRQKKNSSPSLGASELVKSPPSASGRGASALSTVSLLLNAGCLDRRVWLPVPPPLSPRARYSGDFSLLFFFLSRKSWAVGCLRPRHWFGFRPSR
jgi:hypothetical protein